METEATFRDLQQFRLSDHGDARERAIWPSVSSRLSNYEKFWQTFVVLLTNRVDPKCLGSDEWIRLRPGLPRQYEDLAMSNYSALYYAASAAEQMRENDARIESGRHYRPELVFFYLGSCIENAKKLRGTARLVLGRIGVKCELPKHPDATRLLLPTEMPLRMTRFLDVPQRTAETDSAAGYVAKNKKDDFLRWSDSEKIPTEQMVDCSKCQEELWTKLSDFLQDTWGSLAGAFMTARTQDEFIKDVNLSALLPIRVLLGNLHTTSPFSASGTIIHGND